MPRDSIETLREYNSWRRGTSAPDIEMPNPTVIGLAIDDTIAEVEHLRKEVMRMKEATMRARVEIERLEAIERAAQTLIKMRGRHNTQIAYLNLEKAVSCKA